MGVNIEGGVGVRVGFSGRMGGCISNDVCMRGWEKGEGGECIGLIATSAVSEL